MPHKAINEIGIVLNSGLFSVDNSLFLSEAQLPSAFYNELLSSKYNSVLIGPLLQPPKNSKGFWKPDKASIISLGHAPKGRFKKLLFYLNCFFKSFFLPLPGNIYFFFPGNISLALFPGVFLRKRTYAIYLRGDIRYKNIFAKSYATFMLKNAQFILATGPHATSKAKKHNKYVEEVVPMINVKQKNLEKRHPASVNPSTTRILFLSTIKREKGVVETIMATKRLIDAGYDIELTLVGRLHETFLQLLQSQVETCESFLRIAGKIDDKKKLHEFYRASDVFVFPSYHEGFPRVLYEAMTFSLPIVATDIPGIKGLMQNEYNCLKVPPRNHVLLAEAIERLIKDPSLRTRLSVNAYSTMKKIFETIEDNSHAKQLMTHIYNKNKRHNNDF